LLGTVRGTDALKDLEARGITGRAGSISGLAEKASITYKVVNSVVAVVHSTGIPRTFAITKTIGVIKRQATNL